MIKKNLKKHQKTLVLTDPSNEKILTLSLSLMNSMFEEANNSQENIEFFTFVLANNHNPLNSKILTLEWATLPKQFLTMEQLFKLIIGEDWIVTDSKEPEWKGIQWVPDEKKVITNK